MRADPVGQALRPGGLRIGVVRRAERSDEQLRRHHLAGRSRPSPPASCRRSRRTCARRRRGSAAWSATAAPPRRGRARSSGYSRSRRDGRRDAPPTTAAASPLAGAARDGPPPSPAAAADPWPPPRAAGTAALQRLVAQAFRQRPAQAGPPRPPDAVAGGRRARPKLAAILRLDMPAARSLSTSRILRMGNLCPGMPRSLSKGAKPCRFADHPTAPVTPVHRLVAIARNGWSRSIGTPGRNQSESAGRNQPVRALA